MAILFSSHDDGSSSARNSMGGNFAHTAFGPMSLVVTIQPAVTRRRQQSSAKVGSAGLVAYSAAAQARLSLHNKVLQLGLDGTAQVAACSARVGCTMERARRKMKRNCRPNNRTGNKA